MLAPVCVTGPAAAPVSLAEAKAHLRVDHEDDDIYITALIDAATAHLDGWSGILGRALVTQTWRQSLGAFPADGMIRLPLAPVSAVAQITYRDADGAEHQLDPSVYSSPLADGLGPYVRLTPGPRPATARRDDAVSVDFVAGYGDPADVPQSIRHAILLLAGHWYAVREPVNIGNITSPLDFSVTALLAPYRRISI